MYAQLFMLDDTTSILSFIAALLGVLLALSEILAWSRCEVNSISEIFFKPCRS